MLILKIDKGREKIKKIKGIFRKKIIYETANDIKRYSINVNGKNVTVLELPEEEIGKEDVSSLLKIYKGRVLIAEEYYHNDILKEYLFDPREYYQRATLSSLINQIRTVRRDWKNICIRISEFIPFKEFFHIVKISKTLTLITPKSPVTDKFLHDCYYEFGAIVFVKDEPPLQTDVFLDLEQIDAKGRLMVNVNGRDFILYPDATYFGDKEEYQRFSLFNIEHNLICAAFSDK